MTSTSPPADLDASANRDHPSDADRLLKFPAPGAAAMAIRRRDEIVARVGRRATRTCRGAKLHTGAFTPGCRLCVEGAWSCLFVNATCNAACFFCPKRPHEGAAPTAEELEFDDPDEYVAYLGTWDCRGVGISGGEPLLSLGRTLEFVARIREGFSESMFIWLYTNGIAANRTALEALRVAGLDEIRLNIAAQDYRIDAVRTACAVFKTVVVEIPVVPEETGRLVRLVRELDELGVACLNLHQLWCSPHNAGALVERGYTFLRGARISVMESELAALHVLQEAGLHRHRMGVHYCSSVYKQRYQTRAVLRRHALAAAAPHEDVTEAGLIRRLWIVHPKAGLDDLIRDLRQAGATDRDLYVEWERGRVHFRIAHMNGIDWTAAPPRVAYDVAYRSPGERDEGTRGELGLGPTRGVRLARAPVLAERSLTEAEWKAFGGTLFGRPAESAGAARWRAFPPDIREFEELQSGLGEYC